MSETQPRFERLLPVGDDYAVRPIADAIDWRACFAPGHSGEWYLVVFPVDPSPHVR